LTLQASLECFEAAGMENLRKKSIMLTGYLEKLIGMCESIMMLYYIIIFLMILLYIYVYQIYALITFEELITSWFWIDFVLDEKLKQDVTILTPRDPNRRGCQLSLEFNNPTIQAKEIEERLKYKPNKNKNNNVHFLFWSVCIS
jgi:kynureninase